MKGGRKRERGGRDVTNQLTFFGEATAPVGATAALFLLPPRAPAEGSGKAAAGFCVLPVATLELWLGEGVEGGTSLLGPAAAGHTSTPGSRQQYVSKIYTIMHFLETSSAGNPECNIKSCRTINMLVATKVMEHLAERMVGRVAGRLPVRSDGWSCRSVNRESIQTIATVYTYLGKLAVYARSLNCF